MILYLNIEKMRKYNEKFGHQKGDQLLKRIETELLKYGDVERNSDEFFLYTNMLLEKLLRELEDILKRYKARERYSFGWSDWRGVYGNAGA